MTIHQSEESDLRLERSKIVLLLSLYLLATLFESFGLVMLLPVFQFIQAGENVEALVAGSPLWAHLVGVFSAIGLPVTLPILLGTSLTAILLRQTFIYVRLVYSAALTLNLISRVRNRIFNSYLQARLDFHDGQRIGDVLNDLTTDLQRAVEMIFGRIFFVGIAIMAVIYVVILLLMSPYLTAVALAVGALSGAILSQLIRRSKQTGEAVAETNRDVSDFLVQRLRLVRLIRLSGTEDAEKTAMRRLNASQRGHMIHIARLQARVNVAIEPIVVLAGFVFLYVGVQHFSLGLEQIGLFLVIILRLMPVVKELARSRQSNLAALGAFENIRQRLRTLDNHRESASGIRPFATLQHSITFENVTFSYPGRHGVSALNRVSLTVPAGRVTALVGPSGSGKSTLVDLLPRLREPLSGNILIDGVKLNEYDVNSLRRGIAFVSQAPQIFNVTAADHIRYGKPDATTEEIVEAARMAGAEDFITALPQGYNTPLGEGGGRLSGGQRQRLDLARALVRRVPLLILDEPAANLDAEAEEKFRASLQRIRQKSEQTILIIGHRLFAIADADQIVVLEDGRVLETGIHAELIARGGWYARAYGLQTDDGDGASKLVATSAPA